MPSFETAARSLKVVAITAPVHDDRYNEAIRLDPKLAMAYGNRVRTMNRPQ